MTKEGATGQGGAGQVEVQNRDQKVCPWGSEKAVPVFSERCGDLSPRTLSAPLKHEKAEAQAPWSPWRGDQPEPAGRLPACTCQTRPGREEMAGWRLRGHRTQRHLVAIYERCHPGLIEHVFSKGPLSPRHHRAQSPGEGGLPASANLIIPFVRQFLLGLT